MADTRGTFRLKNVRQDVLNNEYVPVPNVWLQENDVGHFRDSVDTDGPLSRTNLDTELTAYAPGITNITRWSAGSSCYTHGLFAGGAASGSTSAPAISSTYKLTYSSYTSARAPSANLPVPKAISIGVASEDNAYINSGYEGGGSPAGQTGTCKISFATDTATNLPSANIAAINWEMQSLTDGAGGGYLFGGTWVPGQANTGSRCYKITYATDGLAQLPGSNTTWNTSETNRNPETSRASMMNLTAGYQSGGNSFPGSDGSSMTTKLTYSSMAWSVVPGAYLPNPRRKSASGTGSRGKAWYGCGQQSGNQSNFTLLDFSAETWSAVPGMNHPGPSSSGQESANTSTSPRDSLKGADKAFDLGYDSGKSERWFDGALGGSYGVGFDGSGDYLQMASSSDLTFGTGDFTIEFYVNATNFTNRGTFYDSRPSGGNTGITIGHEASSGEIRVYMNAGHGGDIIVQSTDFTTGVWYHIAVTRSSGTVRLFINGVLKDTETPSERDMNNTNVVNIGYKTYSSSGYNYLNGTISSFRVLKGTALYTSNFDRPITALTNISDTKLLCCQSSSSTTTKEVGPTITANGDPTVILSQTLPTGPPAPTPTPSSTPQSPAPISPTAFFMAGRDPGPSEYSSCGKIQFASETRSALPGSNIPARKFVCGTSSTLAGYCFGDSNQVAKLLYATDASSTLPSTLPGGYRYKSAISNDTVAFTFGGWQNYSTIDKLTFSNDTVSANTPTNRPPENLRYFTGQLSGPTKGYFCTGATSPSYPGRDKKCHYITFATDSGSEGPEAPEIRDAVGSCSNATVGYITGGRGPGSPQEKSNTSKFTFATESWSNVPGAPLASKTYALSGTSNQTFAYFSGGSVGGAGPAVKATTRKFTFASETMGPGTSLDVPRWGFGYTANTESNHPQTTPQPNIPHVI